MERIGVCSITGNIIPSGWCKKCLNGKMWEKGIPNMGIRTGTNEKILTRTACAFVPVRELSEEKKKEVMERFLEKLKTISEAKKHGSS